MLAGDIIGSANFVFHGCHMPVTGRFCNAARDCLLFRKLSLIFNCGKSRGQFSRKSKRSPNKLLPAIGPTASVPLQIEMKVILVV